MRIIRLLFLCLIGIFIAQTIVQGEETPTTGTKSIKLLTIGNSFSICLEQYLPQVVASVPGCEIQLVSLCIGGCTLGGHWGNIVKEEANPNDRYFKEYTYREIIESTPWDFISIQQSSPLSWKPDSYFPEVELLRDYIRQYAPTAEILLQETWSYRGDDARLGRWGFDNNVMSQKIHATIEEISEKTKLRYIPVGVAVQLARENQPGGYTQLDHKDYTFPALPDMNRYFCGSADWNEEKTNIIGDTYHLNNRGCYLQACVWFAFLFDRPATDITFVPEEISSIDAHFMQEIAQRAVESLRSSNDQE